MTSMSRQQQISEVFVELADTLVDEFDIIDFLQNLCTRCVELLDVSAAGIMLADSYGTLQTVAASDENTRLLELFSLQHDQGPCVECYARGVARTDIDLAGIGATTEWTQFSSRAREAGFATAHAFPLRLRQQAVGAMNLFRTDHTPLGEEDASLAQALADVATIGILQQRTLERSLTERTQLQAALTSRIVIEQAKGILAERWDVSPDHAFTAMRGYARGHGRRISMLAGQIIEGEAPEDLTILPAGRPKRSDA
ncbi:GAF and ANTAR domain-containing protein [Streptomyces sp. NPDC050617]|uniref:GAF and ANTAR domain-containing protein n=1 Tax=Streptomyces sp. NPDC050617 TaxID=3154628 RepID=UPI00341F212A